MIDETPGPAHRPGEPPGTPEPRPEARTEPTPGAINRPPIQYKGADLEPERGPGLGCFRFQLVVLAILVILTPISVVAGWPEGLSAALLFVVIALLLVSGQTMIFLMRLIAADRRTRRRPLGSATKTVGELEDEATGATTALDDPPDGDGVRQ
ncbi:MAG: hypothetical protein ACRDGQ_11480 [Candidatus Limnocylindrales bacterium]